MIDNVICLFNKNPVDFLSMIGTWVSGIATALAIWFSLAISRRAERVKHLPMPQIHHCIQRGDSMYDFIGIEIENAGTEPIHFLPVFYFYKDILLFKHNEPSHVFFKYMPDVMAFMNARSMWALGSGQRRKIAWIDRAYHESDKVDKLIELMSNGDFYVVIPYTSIDGVVRITYYSSNGRVIDRNMFLKKYNIPKSINLIKRSLE